MVSTRAYRTTNSTRTASRYAPMNHPWDMKGGVNLHTQNKIRWFKYIQDVLLNSSKNDEFEMVKTSLQYVLYHVY
jgi:hypothetical protein